MAGRSGGMVREAVWKAGKRVERLLDVCFGAWVKGAATAAALGGYSAVALNVLIARS